MDRTLNRWLTYCSGSMTVHKCDANIPPITVISFASHSSGRRGIHSLCACAYTSSWSCKSLLRPDRRVPITGVNRPWHDSLASSRYRSSRHLKFTREQTGSLSAERLAFYRCRARTPLHSRYRVAQLDLSVDARSRRTPYAGPFLPSLRF